VSARLRAALDDIVLRTHANSDGTMTVRGEDWSTIVGLIVMESNGSVPDPRTAEADNPTCVCGHVEDEHEDIGTCTIDDCLCGGWEEDE
jgi:hypothetical protein